MSTALQEQIQFMQTLLVFEACVIALLAGVIVWLVREFRHVGAVE